jgi:hypothetical protein
MDALPDRLDWTTFRVNENPQDLEEAGEVGMKVDSEEGEMEVYGLSDATNAKNKVIWPDTTLTRDDHGYLTAGIMGTQLNTTQN